MGLGLRGRFVALLALVSALTLAVAAVALFSPLDRLPARERARDARPVGPQRAGRLHEAAGEAIHAGSPRLLAATRPLRRTGAEVAVLGRLGAPLVTTDPDRDEFFPAARQTLRTVTRRS